MESDFFCTLVIRMANDRVLKYTTHISTVEHLLLFYLNNFDVASYLISHDKNSVSCKI